MMNEKNSMQEEQKYKEEFDFRDLLRYPGKLFGYYYIYIFAIIIAIGATYVTRLTNIGKNSITPSLPPDSAMTVTDIPLQSPRVNPPVDVLKISVSTPELITTGGGLYKANCASCHGEAGKGDGPAGAVLNPKPRNFTSPDGWTNGSKISQIYRTLEEGIVKNGMASFNYLTPQDRFALIHFVRSFHKNQPADSVEELKQLDATFALSKGMAIPGHIPIRKAKAVILKENDAKVAEVASYIAQVESSATEGAQLLRKTAKDKHKVFASLLHRTRRFNDSNDFIATISLDPLQFGFKPGILQLTNNEWLALYSYVMMTIQKGNS